MSIRHYSVDHNLAEISWLVWLAHPSLMKFGWSGLEVERVNNGLSVKASAGHVVHDFSIVASGQLGCDLSSEFLRWL